MNLFNKDRLSLKLITNLNKWIIIIILVQIAFYQDQKALQFFKWIKPFSKICHHIHPLQIIIVIIILVIIIMPTIIKVQMKTIKIHFLTHNQEFYHQWITKKRNLFSLKIEGK